MRALVQLSTNLVSYIDLSETLNVHHDVSIADNEHVNDVIHELFHDTDMNNM